MCQVLFNLSTEMVTLHRSSRRKICYLLTPWSFSPNPLYEIGPISLTLAKRLRRQWIIQIFVPLEELQNTFNLHTVHALFVVSDFRGSHSWKWTKEGSMLFTASGSLVEFEDLPSWLQTDITTRLPLYRHALAILDLPDSTSWSY